MISKAEMAKYIDHTLLKSDAKEAEVKKVCDEAKEYGFYAVCVNSNYISSVAKELEGTDVVPCSVIGFPLGASILGTNEKEASLAVAAGARELDLVMNLSAAKNGDWDAVAEDIKQVVKAAEGKALVKLIIEVCLLTDDEIVKASQIGKECGVSFIKTSSGFSTGGATFKAVHLIRQTVGPDFGIKASGGIRSYDTADRMIEAGATRIGASASVAIVS